MKFPKHINLTIEHNPHNIYYQSVSEYVGNNNIDDCWISAEDRKEALETNDFWTAQWYPDTPVGFYRQHAATLEKLLNYLEGVTP